MKIGGNKMSGIKVKLDIDRSIRHELERQNEDCRYLNVWYRRKIGYKEKY